MSNTNYNTFNSDGSVSPASTSPSSVSSISTPVIPKTQTTSLVSTVIPTTPTTPTIKTPVTSQQVKPNPLYTNSLNPNNDGTGIPVSSDTPTKIDASSISNTTPLNTTTSSTDSSGNTIDANGNVTVKSSSSFVGNLPTTYLPPDTNSTLTAAEQQNKTLQDKLASLQSTEVGKSAATQQAYSDAGVFDAQKNVQSLYNNLQIRTAQFQQAEENARNTGDLKDAGQGMEALAQRQAAAELGVDTAVYNAAVGNLTTAKSIADQTINFQYAPIEQKIADTQQFLDLNKTNLSIGQQKQADIMQGSLALQSAQIAQAKTDRQNSFDIMNTAAASGLTDPTTLKNIANSDPATAASLAAPYLSYAFQLNLYQQGIISTPPTIGGTSSSSNTPTNLTPAVANNNPGNLKDPATGQFQQFPSMQAGFLALQSDLYGKVTGATTTGLNANSTLTDFANVYAPKSDGNDPTQYAKNLAAQLGVSTNTKIGQFKDNIAQFANAVSMNEDKNANAIVNGKQPTISQTTSNNLTQNGQDFTALKQSAPPLISSALLQLSSNGNTFINSDLLPSNGQQLARNFAKANGNIPILTGTQATDAQTLDAAIRNLTEVIAPAWEKIAPTSKVQANVNVSNFGFSKLGDTQFYTDNNTFAANQESIAQQIKALSDSAPKAGLIKTAVAALPDNSQLFHPVSGNYDTLKDGNAKIQRTLDLLNEAQRTYFPNSRDVTLNQNSPENNSVDLTTMQNSQGQTLVQGSDGLYYPQ